MQVLGQPGYTAHEELHPKYLKQLAMWSIQMIIDGTAEKRVLPSVYRWRSTAKNLLSRACFLNPPINLLSALDRGGCGDLLKCACEMPSCCVSNCSNTSMKVNRVNGDISFHLFPKDPDLKNRWILATGKKNWFPTKNSSICSAHFDSTDFNDTKKSRRLSQFAYPTIDVWKTTDEESSDEASNGRPKNRTANDTLESAPSSPDSRIASPIQPPIVKRLLKQRTRLLAALKLEKMKVKRFREQNRRKDKKIATLHNIIFDLKRKIFSKDAEIEQTKYEEVNIDNDDM